jgi:translation initiation factor 1A|tara:strand:+ start:1140 stop:1679 length:540 start_codon:yes stop_codon:yes gene_type:complete
MGKKSNIKGGNKHKKYAKEREVEIKLNIFDLDKTDEQEFAFVTKMLGNKRCELQCSDKKKRIGLIRGSKKNMSKRHNWITTNSLVLISLRSFSTIDDKCDIIKLYNKEEVLFLLEKKKISANFVKNGSFRTDNNENETVSFISANKIKTKKIERNYNDLYAGISEESEEDMLNLNIDNI